MSFSPQLQTIWVPVFLGLSLCFKARRTVRLGLALFCWWGMWCCWAHQPGGSRHWIAASFVVPAATPSFFVWPVEEMQTLEGARALCGGWVPRQPGHRSAFLSLPSDCLQCLESGHSLPRIWLLTVLYWSVFLSSFPGEKLFCEGYHILRSSCSLRSPRLIADGGVTCVKKNELKILFK